MSTWACVSFPYMHAPPQRLHAVATFLHFCIFVVIDFRHCTAHSREIALGAARAEF